MVALDLPTGVVFDLDPDAYDATPVGDPLGDGENTGVTIGGRLFYWGSGDSNELPNPGPQVDAGWAPAPASTRTNLATRPRPEPGSTDVTGWRADQQGDTVPAGVTVSVRDAADGIPAAWRAAFASATGSNSGLTAYNQVQDVLDNGEQWTFTMKVRTSSYIGLRLNVTWAIPGGREYYGTTSSVTVWAGSNTNNGIVTLTFTNPAYTGATGVFVRVQKASGGWNAGEWVEVLEFQAEKGTVAKPYFDGGTVGEWTGVPFQSTSVLTLPDPATDVVATLDTTLARRTGKQSRKLVRQASNPSKIVCAVDGIGGTAGGAVTMANTVYNPRTLVHVYTEDTGLSATLTGVGTSAVVPLVPGEWTRVEALSSTSLTTHSGVLLVTTSGPTTGGETVWICDAMCTRQSNRSYFDGDSPGARWAGAVGGSASEGVPTLEESSGRKEFAFRGMPNLYTGDSYFDDPEAVTIAFAGVPMELFQTTTEYGFLQELEYGVAELRFSPGNSPDDCPFGGYAAVIGSNNDFWDSTTPNPDPQGDPVQHYVLTDTPLRFVGTTISGAQKGWMNGVLTQESAEAYTLSTNQGFDMYMNGSLRRFIVWHRVLTDAEIAQVTAQLEQLILEKITATWTAPAQNGGSPVTGYLVRHFDGQTVNEYAVGADQTSVEMQVAARSGWVQVIAMNALGRSAPVEVEVVA